MPTQSINPVAYVTEEGGEYLAWDDPAEAFAIFYDDGTVLDRVVGLYSDLDATTHAGKVVSDAVYRDSLRYWQNATVH